jgi:hypothetical protein
MSDKLNINNEMRQFDMKNRGFYDELTDEEKKKFSNFLMLRWGSAVQAGSDIQAYYVMSLNENLNKHFFELSKHPKLQWLCATAVSPGVGAFKHAWIAPKKKEGTDNKATKFLKLMYPNSKDDEIELLRQLNTKDDLRQLAREHGWDDKRIKADL